MQEVADRPGLGLRSAGPQRHPGAHDDACCQSATKAAATPSHSRYFAINFRTLYTADGGPASTASPWRYR